MIFAAPCGISRLASRTGRSCGPAAVASIDNALDGGHDNTDQEITPMKVRNSLKSLRGRHRMNQLVRRRGRVYIINKVQKRFKARQG